MRRPIACAAAALAVVLAQGTGARAGDPSSFRSSGSCTEYAAGFTVDAARAQAAVPEGFAVLGAAGRAMVSAFVMDCEASIDDGPRRATIAGGVLVILDPASSPAGCQAYDFFWHDRTAGPWIAPLDALGWRTEQVDGASLAIGPDAAEADVQSTFAPWSAEAVRLDAWTPHAPLVTVHCHLGERGVIRGTYEHDIETSAAAGPVALGDGPLWDALGASSTDIAPGIAFSFTWTGVTELVS